jgi:hypothetical protein
LYPSALPSSARAIRMTGAAGHDSCIFDKIAIPSPGDALRSVRTTYTGYGVLNRPASWRSSAAVSGR